MQNSVYNINNNQINSKIEIFFTKFHNYMKIQLDKPQMSNFHNFRDELHWRFVFFYIQRNWYDLALNLILKYIHTLHFSINLLNNNLFWNVFSLLLHKIKVLIYSLLFIFLVYIKY